MLWLPMWDSICEVNANTSPPPNHTDAAPIRSQRPPRDSIIMPRHCRAAATGPPRRRIRFTGPPAAHWIKFDSPSQATFKWRTAVCVSRNLS